MIGWREARRRAERQRPAPTVPGPGFVPRLRVYRSGNGYRWTYEVWEGCLLRAYGHGDTHAEALAVGLAALEAATVAAA